MMAWKIGPALATGNVTIVKPAEQVLKLKTHKC